MLISQPYTFEFPTVALVEKLLRLNPQQLSSIANKWAGIRNLTYCTLGCPNAYGTVTKQQLDKRITGIDIPVLIRTAKPSKGVVFILAQDPLRKKEDYPLFNNWDTEIVVSLPFGVHVHNVVKVINWTCDYILGCGYDVYITDCTKIYSKGQSKKTDKDLLKEEIKQLNLNSNTAITHYIAFGNRAQAVLGALKNVIPIVHPSGSANAQWKKEYNSECTVPVKIATIENILAKNGIK